LLENILIIDDIKHTPKPIQIINYLLILSLINPSIMLPKNSQMAKIAIIRELVYKFRFMTFLQ